MLFVLFVQYFYFYAAIIYKDVFEVTGADNVSIADKLSQQIPITLGIRFPQTIRFR